MPIEQCKSLSAPRMQRERRARSSTLHISANILLAINGIVAWDTVDATAPVPQPARFTHASATEMETAQKKADPADNIEHLFRHIRNAEDLAHFLREHCTHRDAAGLQEFLDTFRCRPERLQDASWNGPCNAFAEFTAQWAYRHGGIPYLVSLYPEGALPKFRESWHQFTVNKLPTGSFLICDNTKVVLWNQSLETYIAERHPGKTMLCRGGLVRWRLLQDTWQARLVSHLMLNETDLECAPLPLYSTPPPPPLLAEHDSDGYLTPQS